MVRQGIEGCCHPYITTTSDENVAGNEYKPIDTIRGNSPEDVKNSDQLSIPDTAYHESHIL